MFYLRSKKLQLKKQTDHIKSKIRDNQSLLQDNALNKWHVSVIREILGHLTIGHVIGIWFQVENSQVMSQLLQQTDTNVSAMKCTATYLFQPHLQKVVKVHTSEFSAWNTNCIIIISKTKVSLFLCKSFTVS